MRATKPATIQPNIYENGSLEWSWRHAKPHGPDSSNKEETRLADTKLRLSSASACTLHNECGLPFWRWWYRSAGWQLALTWPKLLRHSLFLQKKKVLWTSARARLHLKWEDECSPLFPRAPRRPPTSADYSRAHFHVGQSITRRDEDSVWRAVIHSPGWALWECVLPGFSRSGCLSPPPPPPPLYSPLLARRAAYPSLTFHSLSISLIDSARLQALSVFVSPRQVAFFRNSHSQMVGVWQLSPFPLIHSSVLSPYLSRPPPPLSSSPQDAGFFFFFWRGSAPELNWEV